MTERTVSIRLQINDQEYAGRLKRMGQVTDSVLDKTEQKAAKSRQAMSQLSSTLGLVGAAAVAGAGVAIKAYADFDQAMSNVKATGDDARGSFDELRAAALKAGKDTKFSATEAAAGVENLLKAGVQAKDVLGGGLSGALDLAAAGGLDVADAAETAATAMTQFKLAGTDVPHIADLLAAGAGKAQGEVSDMAMALKQSGLVASQFGLSLEDTTGTLAAFASAGLIGSDAGTSFKTMLLALANPSDKAKGTMEELGVAAYDAQGNFVGITNLAGQLKEKLDPLPQAQRDAALATIFGSDAIRAANVLYQQGAEGIETWTDKVNDAGYAAETAATKMDNLSGDIEAFMGSVETALIGVGEGADGPLRNLVQRATEAVNAFSELPEGVQSATLAIVGGGGLVLLGVAGIGKLISTVGDAVGAVKDLGLTSQRAGRLMDIAAKGALVATAAALAIEVKKFADATKEMELGGLTSDLERFGKTGQATGDLLKNFGSDFQGVSHDLTADSDSLGDAFWWVSRLKSDTELMGNGFKGFADGLNQSIDKLEAAAGGGDEYVKRIEEMDAGLAQLVKSGNAEDAAKAFDRMRAMARDHGIAMGDLLAIFPEYTGALDGVAADQQAAAVAAGETARKTGDAGVAAETATPPTQTYADTLKTAADEAAALKEEADLLYDSLQILAGTTISAEEANIAFRDQLRGMASQVKALKDEHVKHATSLKEGTEAGDANRQMLIDGVSAAEKAAKAVYDHTFETKGQDAAVKAASETMAANVLALEKEAVHLGINKGEVDKYIAKILGIPVSQVTKYTAPGLADAKRDVKGLADELDRVKSKESKQKITLDTSNIPREVLIYKGSGNGNADGGFMVGPGTGRSDSIVTRVSNGEFITNAADTARNRAALEAGNHGATLMAVPGYRDGGIVSTDAMSLPYKTPGMGTALDRTDAFANAYNAIPTQVSKMLLDWMKEATEATQGGYPGGGGPVGGNAAANMAIGRSLLAAYGWGAGQWQALRALWMGESGWNQHAHNASSGAHGIPQSLPASKMRAAGADYMTNARTQIRWGLGYIRDRYGSPASAWSAWQSRSPHWYGDGGQITEPIAGLGLRTGRAYGFGERGSEWVVPEKALTGGNLDAAAIAAIAAAIRPNVTVPITNAQVDVGQLTTEVSRAIAFAA